MKTRVKGESVGVCRWYRLPVVEAGPDGVVRKSGKGG